MLIKDFINSRNNCPICEEQLQITLKCGRISEFNFHLNNEQLTLTSRFFNILIDIRDNTVLQAPTTNHWELGLSLFCPIHTSLELEYYECVLNYDVYCKMVVNENVNEYLRTDKFQLNSDLVKQEMEYINLQNRQLVIFPYFDYSNMSLSKLKSKIKTYLIMQ